jgi:lipopolysaccharide export system permease protein
MAVKQIDRFVLKSFIGPLIFTFFIVLIILILQFLWMYIDDLAGKGLDYKILTELLFQFSLSFVPTALPLAILLASLMTFGNMGEFSELSALKSSGISLQRIMRPLIILSSIISLVSFLFGNNVVPYSTRKARTLLFDIRQKRPDINIQAGTFYNGIDGFSIKITTKDALTNRLDKLIIYDHRVGRGNTVVTMADSGYMRITLDETALIMTLYNGYTFTEMEEKNVIPALRKYPSRTDSFKEQTLVLSLTGFDLERSSDNLFKSNSATKNVTELRYCIDSLNSRYNNQIAIQFKEFNSTKLYVVKNFLPNFAVTSDSTNKKKKPGVFRPDELLDSLPVTEKINVLERAIESLKNGSNYLSEQTESHKYELKAIKKYEIDLNKKLTLSFACLIFFFIGAPLGAIIRKGGLGTPAVVSILFFVIWYVLSLSGEKLAEANHLTTFTGMWASSFILFPIGLFLTYKASNDSMIMNIDTYLVFFKNIKDYIYRLTINGTFRFHDLKNNK